MKDEWKYIWSGDDKIYYLQEDLERGNKVFRFSASRYVVMSPDRRGDFRVMIRGKYRGRYETFARAVKQVIFLTRAV